MPSSLHSQEYEQFRRALVEARKKAGLSQTQLADKLSRPQSFISKFERGERRLDVIEFRRISAAIGVDPLRFLRKVYGALGGSSEDRQG